MNSYKPYPSYTYIETQKINPVIIIYYRDFCEAEEGRTYKKYPQDIFSEGASWRTGLRIPGGETNTITKAFYT